MPRQRQLKRSKRTQKYKRRWGVAFAHKQRIRAYNNGFKKKKKKKKTLKLKKLTQNQTTKQALPHFSFANCPYTWRRSWFTVVKCMAFSAEAPISVPGLCVACKKIRDKKKRIRLQCKLGDVKRKNKQLKRHRSHIPLAALCVVSAAQCPC